MSSNKSLGEKKLLKNILHVCMAIVKAELPTIFYMGGDSRNYAIQDMKYSR